MPYSIFWSDAGLFSISNVLGGAERLVVDAALGLQRLGHSVDIYTSYHDPEHCFEETRNGMPLVQSCLKPFALTFK